MIVEFDPDGPPPDLAGLAAAFPFPTLPEDHEP